MSDCTRTDEVTDVVAVKDWAHSFFLSLSRFPLSVVNMSLLSVSLFQQRLTLFEWMCHIDYKMSLWRSLKFHLI